MSALGSVAEPRLARILDADFATRRVAIDTHADRPARAANDNGRSGAHRLYRLWPLAAALLLVIWGVLTIIS
jgi:hypothetical protein